jgi:hypothetical protein
MPTFEAVLGHPYYKQLLDWDDECISPDLVTISDSLQEGTLVICSDGYFQPTAGKGSHGWVFSTLNGKILWKGAGPACGHSDLMSAYCAKLSGLISILYIINYVIYQQSIANGLATVYCDNTSALVEVFSKPYCSPNPYRQLQSDIDLITCSRYLLKALPPDITLQHCWIKSHYKGPSKHLEHNFNELADSIAGSYNDTPHPESIQAPIAHPTSTIEV